MRRTLRHAHSPPKAPERRGIPPLLPAIVIPQPDGCFVMDAASWVGRQLKGREAAVAGVPSAVNRMTPVSSTKYCRYPVRCEV